jgi:hypothetical protein
VAELAHPQAHACDPVAGVRGVASGRQAQLGHTKMSTTLEIYTPPLPAHQRAAVERLSQLVTNGDELHQFREGTAHAYRADSVISGRKYGRHVGTRTPDLYRVKIRRPAFSKAQRRAGMTQSASVYTGLQPPPAAPDLSCSLVRIMATSGEWGQFLWGNLWGTMPAYPLGFRFAQRARAAFLAISLRRSGVRLLRRAWPPLPAPFLAIVRR